MVVEAVIDRRKREVAAASGDVVVFRGTPAEARRYARALLGAADALAGKDGGA